MKKKNSNVRSLVALFLFGLAHLGLAEEAPIEFLLDNTILGQDVKDGETVTTNGVTMTIVNVLTGNGGNSGTVEQWGILCGTEAGAEDVVSLDISFDVDIRITDYTIGAREDLPEGVFITISGPNGTSGQNEVPAFEGSTQEEIGLSFAEGDLTELKAGETYSLTQNLIDVGGDPLFHLKSLSVTPVSDNDTSATSDGIYIGSFAGQTDNGGFATFVVDGRAEIVGFNGAQEEGVFARNIAVADNGDFSGSTAQGGTFSGTFTSTGVSGDFQPSSGVGGTFSGTKESNTGGLSESAGFYEGSYSGPISGSAFAVLASDGSIFFYVIDDPDSPAADGDGGGRGTISATTFEMNAAIEPDGAIINGSLDPASHEINGSYSLSDQNGTFLIARTKSLPDPLAEFSALAAASGLSGDEALLDAIPFDDGVENLLKFAFNMNLAAPDVSTLADGGNSGLPVAGLDESGDTPVWRVEFVRRKGSGLTYTPQISSTLEADSFAPMTGTPTVTDIDEEWERVVVEEPCDPATTPRCFSRIEVVLSDN
jgi:hypothetical protein